MTLRSPVLEKFEASNPRAAVLLALMDFREDVFCRTEKGEENVRDPSVDPIERVHSQRGALEEAINWASSFEVSKVDLLVVYGIGLGYCWEALLPWLKQNPSRRLIFVEDNLTTVRAFLESTRAEPFFDDPQSTLFFIETGKESREVLETIAWNLYKRAWSCIPSPAYQRYKEDGFQGLLRELSICQAEVTDILQEFFSPGETPLQNFGRNLFLWKKSKNASGLFDRFRDIPVVVVGAGPSLSESLPLLQTLRSKGIIIAGGSSVGALLQAGIVPHFTATVDPNVTQYIRMRQAQPFCLPLLYRSRALHEPLMFHHGPLLYLRGGDGYPLVDYFEHSLHVTGPILEGGHSVSNMIIEIAYAFGCRSIILTGYDLSYVQGDLYAKSVSESLGPTEQVSQGKNASTTRVIGVNRDGRNVETETKWITEGKWIEQFQQLHPKLNLVQTSKEGLFLSGLEYLSFEEAVEKYCSSSKDVDALVHIALEEASPLSIREEKIAESIRSLTESLLEVSGILALMDTNISAQDFSPDSAVWVDLDHQLRSALAYKWVLSPYEAMHAKLMQMQASLEIRPYDDAEAGKRFEQHSLKSRVALLRDMTESYQRFFSAIVSWACLNGISLTNALELAPYKEGAALPKKFFT
jgi:hypothetical protein